MELADVMRHMPGCRDYETRDVPDEVLYRVLDNARFAPSGGNRQGWRVVVVRDAGLRRQMRDLYRPPWQRYVAEHFGPYETMTPDRRRRVDDADRMAENLHLVPVHLVIWVDVATIAVTDIDAGRPSVVAGGSIFPFIQNVQLAARAEGLGTRITTLLSYEEAAVRSLLHVPDDLALAALLLVGWPTRLPTKLNRKPVERFAWLDQFDGQPLRPTDGDG
jgi:nitroreductase